MASCAPKADPVLPYHIDSTGWSSELAPAAADRPAAPLATLLGDPALGSLIAQALTHNPDLAIALARVDRARAELSGARSATLPDVSAQGGLTRRFSEEGGQRLDFTTAFAELDVAWDPDLFGRLRANVRAGLARAEAAEWERSATALAVETGVAQAWIERAALLRRIAIYDHLITRSEELERIVRVRQEAGAATRVELGLQSIRVLELKQQRAELVQALGRTRTALAQLTGSEAPGFTVADPAGDTLALPDLAPPAPSVLLAARPDIRAAEARIRAANGDVDAARATFFPSLKLSFVGMIEAISGTPLSKSVTPSYSLLAPIFARGSLTRDLKIAQADQVEAAETYRRAIIDALAQVENLLSDSANAAERAALVERIVSEAELTARLGTAQYLEGEEDLRTLIDAEQLLGDAQDAQVLVWQERMLAQVALYQAAGGFAG